MTAIPDSVNPSPVITTSLDGLNAICEAGCELVLWQRPESPAIGRELENLPASAFPDLRSRLDPHRAGEQLRELIAMSGRDAPTDFPDWHADMSLLVERFFALTDGRPVTARLESLEHTGCPRFHVDRSYLRLVCTYRGPGTEWLDDSQVDREAQRNGAPNALIARGDVPNRMPTFWVGVMKGSRYPGCDDSGLVHRSPEIKPGEGVRILFSLDC